MSRPPAIAPLEGVSISVNQRRVLERIAAQRQRLRAREAALEQAQTLQASAPLPDKVDPTSPITERLMTFARLHPWAVAGVVGLGVVAGPARLVRWAGVLVPLVMRLKR